jgi:hypothetical protein
VIDWLINRLGSTGATICAVGVVLLIVWLVLFFVFSQRVEKPQTFGNTMGDHTADCFAPHSRENSLPVQSVAITT